MITWQRTLRFRAAGPLDELDDEANGDPDSWLGEESEEGYDDDPFGAEPLFAEDDGFEDAGEGEDDGESADEDEDDEEGRR